MENDLDGSSQPEGDTQSEPNLPTNQKMTPQKKPRCSRSFFVALFLVLVILGVYTIHYRPNSAKSAVEKQHADWLDHMTKERGLQNDTVGYRHYERHEVTQSGEQTGQGQAPISMVMPSNINEDLHRAQTQGMPLQYLPENANASNKLIEMKLDETHARREDDKEDDYKQDHGGDKDDYDGSNEDNKRENKDEPGVGQYDSNTVTNATVPGLQTSNVQNYPGFKSNELDINPVAPVYQTNVQNAPETAPGYQSTLQTETAKDPGFQSLQQTETTIDSRVQSSNLEPKDESVSNYTNTHTIQMQLEPRNYIQPAAPENENPAARSEYMVDGNGPSFNVEQNNNPVISQQNQETNIGDANVPLYNVGQNNNPVVSQQNSEMNIGDANVPSYNIGQNNNPVISPQNPETNIGNANVPSYNIGQNNNHVISQQNPETNIDNANVPSYNIGQNNNPVISQQNLEMNTGNAYGGVVSDINAQLPNANAQIDMIGDRNRLSQTNQKAFDTIERNVMQPLILNGVNRALQGQRSTTKSPYSPYTLSQLLERRMSLHKTLKDMQNIVDYGSPATDEENMKPWNVDENRKHLYDVNQNKNLFANLEMQINIEAEPVTGTKPMRPPFKSRIEYPDYLTPVNWETSFENVKTPVFECVPMKTINSYIRICIHPPAIQSEVSKRLKSAASWEYNALMDAQKALLENRDAIMIDIGASFGVFSLAAAALNRNVIAVEPFPSHIQVLKQSVSLNTFKNHITLFQAVISDRRGKVLIKPLGDHVDNVYIQTAEDNEQSTNYTLVVNSVTLDDIEKVCPSRVAVLKIDVPGFMRKALEYSHFFFKYIHVTHVFMHWDTQDKELCLFILRYFVERGYLPYGDLNGNTHLELKDAYTWTNDIVIWKL